MGAQVLSNWLGHWKRTLPVETLKILTDDDKSADDVQKRLQEKIRDRMFTIYNLTAEERRWVQSRLGALG